MDPFARRKLGRTRVELTQLGFGGAGIHEMGMIPRMLDL